MGQQSDQGKIVCIGRPILDIYISIDEVSWRSLNARINIESQPIRDVPGLLAPYATEIFYSAGGVESNVALNCAYFGQPSMFVGAFGHDELYSILRQHKSALPNFALAAKLCAEPSAVIVIIQIFGRQERIIKLVDYGASENLDAAFLRELSDEILQSHSVFMSCFTFNTDRIRHNCIAALSEFGRAGKEIIVNLGGIDGYQSQQQKDLINWIGQTADIVSLNHIECKICQDLFQAGPNQIFPQAKLIISTDGDEGAKIFTRDRVIDVCPRIVPPEEIKCAIGAGDAFLSGFLYARETMCGLDSACDFAARTAEIAMRQKDSHLNASAIARILDEVRS